MPLERFPDTYNGQPLGLAGLASQKNYISLYLNTVYGEPETEAWFKDRYAASGKTLNMGKSCLRFRRLDEVPLDVIGETIARADLDRTLAHYRRGARLVAEDASRRRGDGTIPDASFRTRMRGIPDAGRGSVPRMGVAMKLSDWLDEYRHLDPDSVVRTGRRARGRLGRPRPVRARPIGCTTRALAGASAPSASATDRPRPSGSRRESRASGAIGLG